MSANDSADIVEQAVAEGGAYDIIKKRLTDYGRLLKDQVDGLNDLRQEEFGDSQLKVSARFRVRTENNCIPRDIVQVGDNLVFGYNVFIGLRKETQVEDVFSVFKIAGREGDPEVIEQDLSATFLKDPKFVNDFSELYRYYKNTKLLQLTLRDSKLLAAFQIGERIEDKRVFRWAVSSDGQDVQYIDNRGERDLDPPPAYDFEWLKVGRDQVVNGKYPHINILDELFVETVGGDLTIKIENNTDSGLGIYDEPVEVGTQSIDDAEFFYAAIGDLILLKILPYQESDWRYLIYNRVTEQVQRVDAIGTSCVQLPEDHGVVFPGGYYLQDGQYKTFDDQVQGMHFLKSVRSPNGEDVLYVFYEPVKGIVGLLAYNLITRKLQNPMYGDGFALADDGTIIIFVAVDEPTRVHPMQMWVTPFYSDEHAASTPESKSYLGKIGNRELVRGISDLYSICTAIDRQGISVRLYEDLSKQALKVFDDHYWVGEDVTQDMRALLSGISETSELAIDEFAKVESIRQQSKLRVQEIKSQFEALQSTVRTQSWESASDFINVLDSIRQQRGKIRSAKEQRYIDTEALESIDKSVIELQDGINYKTVEFLSGEQSLTPYHHTVETLLSEIESSKTVVELDQSLEKVENNTKGLDLLSELLTGIQIQDSTIRTRIVDDVSEIYAKLNQVKAKATHRISELSSKESVAQFSAQFKFFTQSVTNALSLCREPEDCDEQLSRLLVQLEDIEGQFSHLDQFLSDILAKREEIHDAFEGHKQKLLEVRHRKSQNLMDAGGRILKSIEKRTLKFTTQDELNSFYASDALVSKVQDFCNQLRVLDNAVKADDLEAKLKAIRDQAVRALRDKVDLYDGDGAVIKLGPRHRFSVNRQELDLTLIPRNGHMYLHLTGTDFFQAASDDRLQALQEYWDVSYESESETVYRAEYLAALILNGAKQQRDGLTLDALKQALQDEDLLLPLIREFTTPRYKEGYERGIHDHDAARILQVLVPTLESADLLYFDPLSRGFAQVFWANIGQIGQQLKKLRVSYETWQERAQSALQMRGAFASTQAADLLAKEVLSAMEEFTEIHPLGIESLYLVRAADYLVQELGRDHPAFIVSKYGQILADELHRSLDDSSWRRFKTSLDKMLGWPSERWHLSYAWVEAMIREKSLDHLHRYIPEAVALINSDERIDRRFTETDLEVKIEGLLGQHSSIVNQALQFSLDEYLERIERHKNVFIPHFQMFLDVRTQVLKCERQNLRLHEFVARPLSSFVRNRLINEYYLPIIGDNLAKQMGTVGDAKRSDLMGLLMMISPPGYGKTTLMEYVASKLGLIFMKINCPSLGHDVHSLDPERAPNATAKQELNKLNLAFEMGSNVMLYLDDIQHTHPEFLQKFISLCDGTRRIEGVWNGQTKTYDMRGKKFCVVMAGNPYTESGEVFKIPDMLANRADIYNLGDVLGGSEEIFELSYLENTLTSNSVLAPLATRDIDDFYRFVKIAKGDNIPATEFSYQYSATEANEVVDILRKLFVVRDTILKVNRQYIASSAQADQYRTEPPFKLQGSYRNMNKMAEKVSPIMNDEELNQLISDHYQGEAQLLTQGAEENLLKLAELRGIQSESQRQRWQDIKKAYQKAQSTGGEDASIGEKIASQLYELVDAVKTFKVTQDAGLAPCQATPIVSNTTEVMQKSIQSIERVLKKLATQAPPNVQVVNQPVPGLDQLLKTLVDAIEHSLFPIVKSMDKKLEIDLRTHYKMKEVSKHLMDIEAKIQRQFDEEQALENSESSRRRND